jgi:hypothetical protein
MRQCDEVENCEPLHCDRSALYLEQALGSNQQAPIYQVRVVYVPPAISPNKEQRGLKLDIFVLH